MAEAFRLDWKGDNLFCARKKVLGIVPDAKYPGVMWRVRYPDGTLSDMVNRSRAKDAAVLAARRILDAQAGRS
jgi:hypothetical protein